MHAPTHDTHMRYCTAGTVNQSPTTPPGPRPLPLRLRLRLTTLPYIYPKHLGSRRHPRSLLHYMRTGICLFCRKSFERQDRDRNVEGRDDSPLASLPVLFVRRSVYLLVYLVYSIYLSWASVCVSVCLSCLACVCIFVDQIFLLSYFCRTSL